MNKKKSAARAIREAQVHFRVLPKPKIQGLSGRTGSRDRSVRLLENPKDFQAILMAAMGLSNAAIFNATGLSAGQVHYRIRKADMKESHTSRMDYRNGTSPYTRMVLAAAGNVLQPRVETDIEAALNNPKPKQKRKKK